MIFSLCITTYNRFDLTIRSFEKVLDDPRIGEIVLVDDHSEDAIYAQLLTYCHQHPKIRLYRNPSNVGMSRNKLNAVDFALNDWCILFDSDNVISTHYLDALDRMRVFRKEQIIMPEEAFPNFIFNEFRGELIDKMNLAGISNRKQFDVLINTCNYVVNRVEYLKCFEHNPQMKGTDTAWYNYLWLKAGNSFYVMPGLRYYHRVHSGSGWMENSDYNLAQARDIKKLMLQL